MHDNQNTSIDRQPLLSIVVPIYNEGENISTLFSRCDAAIGSWTPDYELICVDDGSSDDSLKQLISIHQKDSRWKVLSLSRNFGHQAAYLAGLSHCSGQYIAMIDGDLQDPPEILESFYNKLQEGYDVVYAVRKKRKEAWLKRMTYSLYYKIISSIATIRSPLDSGDFCLMRREVLEQMLTMTEHSLFLRGIRSWVGFRQFGMEYDRDRRNSGETKFTLKKLFQLAYNGIYSFSHFPIKLLTNIGLIVIIISILYSIYILYVKINNPHIPQGFATLAIAIFLFSGVQLVALGIIGEYVLRIYDESRKRPLFIVKKKYM